MNIRRYRNSITKGLFTSYFLTTIFFIIIFFVLSYVFFFNTIEKKSIQYNERMIQSIYDKIESYLREFEQVSFQIYHPEVHTLINELSAMEYNSSGWDYQIKKGKVLAPILLWNGFSQFRDTILSVIFLDKDGSTYIHDGLFPVKTKTQFIEASEYQQTRDKIGALSVWCVDIQEWYDVPKSRSEDKIVLIGRKIINTIQAKDLGVLFIAIDLKSIAQQVENLWHDSNSYFILLDHANEVVLSKGTEEDIDSKQLIYRMQMAEKNTINFNNENYIINQFKSPVSGWTYINLTPFSEIHKDVQYLTRITYLCILWALIGSVAIAVVFSRSITRPILKLEEFANDVENGIMETRLNVKSYKEFNHLASVFNHMIIQLQQIISDNYFLNIRKREAELKALQAQINPHFLYNTLNSINSYAQQCESREIVEMTYALSDILRYSISNIEELVMIQSELMHMENYLLIQNIRYSNTIRIIRDIDPEVIHYRTVCFILQPLIENAIYHGYRDKQGDKVIELYVKKDDDSIVLKVTDHGAGISKDKVGELLQFIYADEDESIQNKRGSDQIGLRNVHQRIRLRFGDNFGIEIVSKLESGFCVQVKVPIIS